MGIARRELLKWGAGLGAATVTGLTLPGTAWAATDATTPRGLPTDSWMSRLSGDLSLLDLTIPGTHDSCCENPAYGTEWSHTQNWGIPQQLTEESASSTSAATASRARPTSSGSTTPTPTSTSGSRTCSTGAGPFSSRTPARPS